MFKPRNHRGADRPTELAPCNSPPFRSLFIVEPERPKAAMEGWDRAKPGSHGTLAWGWPAARGRRSDVGARTPGRSRQRLPGPAPPPKAR